MRARSVAGATVVVLVVAGLAGIGAVTGCVLDGALGEASSCRARSSFGILGVVALVVALVVYLGAWERDQRALRREIARLERAVEEDDERG
jgi:hypothetical protein